MSSVEYKNLQRLRRPNAKGRTHAKPRFIQLFHWFQDTPAWRSLGPAPRAVYIELAKRYNSRNNGDISMSVREAASLVHISKNTASKCFRELEAKGFIKRNRCGSFKWKLKLATTWILTEHEFNGELPTKEFASWHLKKQNPGPNKGPNCRKQSTNLNTLKQVVSQSVF